MTPEAFRRLATCLPEAWEGSHMRHADFRVGKRVFATLGYPDVSFAMVKLTPAQQAELVASAPRVFAPVKGKWGAQGSTLVRLATASGASLKPALLKAWGNVAPKRLLRAQPVRISRQVQRGYQRYLRVVLRLPGVSESTSYGTPSVHVLGKLLSRWRTEEEGALALRCDFLDRQILLQSDPEAFFVTDHYRDYPMILVRLDRIDEGSLADLTERAWRMVAPKKLQQTTRLAELPRRG